MRATVVVSTRAMTLSRQSGIVWTTALRRSPETSQVWSLPGSRT